MANEDLVTQYNQLIWQMEQLRTEANEAGEYYANKLKTVGKKMRTVTQQLDFVSKELARRQVPIVSAPMTVPTNVTNTVNAGFHPQG
jgi:hypothetical protein